MFVNGTGDGELVLRHRPLTAQIALTLVALAAAAAAVVRLSRRVKPWQSGCALALLALLVLAFAGPGWVPFWNGALAGAVLAAITVTVIERVRAKA